MYNLKITKEQAEVIIKALDLFSRIGIAQFEEILKHPTWQKRIWSGEVDLDHIREAEHSIDMAKFLITGERHGGPGITVADEPNRVAYDILQVIQHRLAWDEKPEGGIQVNFRDPIKWSDQPLAKIEKENNDEE